MRYFLLFILIGCTVASCKQVNVYEKQVDLPEHTWKKNQNAVIRFRITDTTEHQLYFVVRHTRQFPYNKLLVRLLIQDSTKKTISSMRIIAPLTDSAGNWNGQPMDDIYYSRIKITPPVMLSPGEYRFVLQQAMKEASLNHILNVGIALNQ
ncbi:MAG: gliding motility lipoprotein GldH [Niabella sp.]